MAKFNSSVAFDVFNMDFNGYYRNTTSIYKSDEFSALDEYAITAVNNGVEETLSMVGEFYEYDRFGNLTWGEIYDLAEYDSYGRMNWSLRDAALPSSFDSAVDLYDAMGTASVDDDLRVMKFLLSYSDTVTLSVYSDSFNGFAGNDKIYGNGGDDRLMGDAGADRLYGDAGNDILFGGTGSDLLSGGTGKDVFVFATPMDARIAKKVDTIADFEHLIDKIDLRYIDANTDLAGDQAFRFIGKRDFSASGQLAYRNGFLVGDLDGDGSADIAIAVGGTLSVKDFLL